MTQIKIPPEAVEAAAKKLWLARKELFGPAFPRKTWEELSNGKRAELLEEARAALRAALNAWPRMHLEYVPDSVKMYRRIILPLPQEKAE